MLTLGALRLAIITILLAMHIISFCTCGFPAGFFCLAAGHTWSWLEFGLSVVVDGGTIEAVVAVGCGMPEVCEAK